MTPFQKIKDLSRDKKSSFYQEHVLGRKTVGWLAGYAEHGRTHLEGEVRKELLIYKTRAEARKSLKKSGVKRAYRVHPFVAKVVVVTK